MMMHGGMNSTGAWLRAPDDETRHRLEQFFLGGPLYCDPCYEKAPTCGDCGWLCAVCDGGEVWAWCTLVLFRP